MSPRMNHLFLKWRVQVSLVFGFKLSAADLLEQMLEAFPNDAYALASRAHLRAQANDRTGAIADYSALVAAQPEQASGWFNLGFLLEQDGQLEAAESAFRRALDLDPKLDRAWYGLGLALIRLRRYDDAVAALKRNTELQPMSPYGWYQLARVHVDRQQPDEAVKIIRHLRGFEPKVAAQLERETGLLSPPATSG
jgi:tetratricopeptide (TPR) repeat protein